MDPQQELFIGLVTGLTALGKENGFGVYDGALPPEGTPYPFVYLGESQQTDSPNKSAVFGTVTQTIKVWTESTKKRGTLSKVMGLVKGYCRNYRHSTNFQWNVRDVSQTILPDSTVSPPLMMGVLDITFHFS